MAGMLAIANVGRAAAFRSGYFPRNSVRVLIRGVLRAGVILSSIRIDLNTGAEPHRCSFSIKGGGGFVPQVGDSIIVGHGTTDQRLFSGTLTQVVRSAVRAADSKPTYQCDAAGWVFEMSMARVAVGFRATSLAPYSIVGRILSGTSPSLSALGFTYSGISTELEALSRYDVSITDDPATAIDGVFAVSGTRWWVDHKRNVWASNSIASALTLDNSSDIARFEFSAYDGARMFTRAEVLGASAETVWDASNNYMSRVPISVNSALGSFWLETNSLQPYLSTNDDFVFGVSRLQGSVIYDTTRFLTGPSYVVLPVSPNANSLIVGTANVNTISPLWHDNWYQVNNKFIYVNSYIGPVSVVANSPYGTQLVCAYWVNDDGPGGTGEGIPGSLSLISGTWNLTTGGLDATAPEYTWSTKGTKVQVLVSRTNTPGVNVAGSIFASSGVVNKTIEDSSLNPIQADQLALAALERGDPAKWASVTFETREHVMPGEIVPVSVRSLTESGVSSLGGNFMVHDVTISGFAGMSETHGPRRAVRGGFVRRPTLWQVLQGDE